MGEPARQVLALWLCRPEQRVASKETGMSTTPRAGEGFILEARKENHRSLFTEGFSRFPGRF